MISVALPSSTHLDRETVLVARTFFVAWGRRAIPFLGTRMRYRVLAASLAWALPRYGNPSFFQFERRGPVQTHLGAGISRVSDSFWPLSQW